MKVKLTTFQKLVFGACWVGFGLMFILAFLGWEKGDPSGILTFIALAVIGILLCLPKFTVLIYGLVKVCINEYFRAWVVFVVSVLAFVPIICVISIIDDGSLRTEDYMFLAVIILSVAVIIATIGIYVASKILGEMQEQTGINRSRLFNEQFSRGMDLLVNEDPVQQSAGLTMLENLGDVSTVSREQRGLAYYILSDFIREKAAIKKDDNGKIADGNRTYEEELMIARMIGAISKFGRRRDLPRLADVDLSGLDLRNLKLSDINLRFINFSNSIFDNTTIEHVDFSDARLFNASFKNADIHDAIFSRTDLISADFLDAKLRKIDVTEAKLCDVQNFTQKQLDECFYELRRSSVYPRLPRGLELSAYRAYTWEENRMMGGWFCRRFIKSEEPYSEGWIDFYTPQWKREELGTE